MFGPWAWTVENPSVRLRRVPRSPVQMGVQPQDPSPCGHNNSGHAHAMNKEGVCGCIQGRAKGCAPQGGPSGVGIGVSTGGAKLKLGLRLWPRGCLFHVAAASTKAAPKPHPCVANIEPPPLPQLSPQARANFCALFRPGLDLRQFPNGCFEHVLHVG